jgi:hypothetical protein
MSYFPPYLRVATISLLNLPALLFRWTRGVESRFSAWPRRGLLGRPLHRSTPVKAHATHNFLLQCSIFFRPMGHYVRDNYSVLWNMAPIYHIVTVRVIWTSWTHVWRLRFCFLRMGYDTTPPCWIFIIHALCRALHSDVGFGYGIVQEEPSWSFSGSTFVKRKISNFLPFLSKGKHRCIPPPPL